MGLTFIHQCRIYFPLPRCWRFTIYDTQGTVACLLRTHLLNQGLDKGVLDALTDPDSEETSDLRRVVYVSCGFDALKRDAVTLIAGGWTLRHTEGYVLFPGSDHVETLAVFDR